MRALTFKCTKDSTELDMSTREKECVAFVKKNVLPGLLLGIALQNFSDVMTGIIRFHTVNYHNFDQKSFGSQFNLF